MVFILMKKLKCYYQADTSTAIAKSIGLATIGFADAFDRLNPDLLVILGDRFEMLAAAQVSINYANSNCSYSWR